jgi:hypothetical protein
MLLLLWLPKQLRLGRQHPWQARVQYSGCWD